MRTSIEKLLVFVSNPLVKSFNFTIAVCIEKHSTLFQVRTSMSEDESNEKLIMFILGKTFSNKMSNITVFVKK